MNLMISKLLKRFQKPLKLKVLRKKYFKRKSNKFNKLVSSLRLVNSISLKPIEAI